MSIGIAVMVATVGAQMSWTAWRESEEEAVAVERQSEEVAKWDEQLGPNAVSRPAGGGITTIRPAAASSTSAVARQAALPVVASTTSTTTAPIETTVAPETPVPLGTEIAKLTIPRLKLELVVREGAFVEQLDLGPGRLPETAPLDEPGGHSVIAGHRTSHGAFFRRLDRLRPGDIVTVETLLGRITEYTVWTTDIVEEADYDAAVTWGPEGVDRLSLLSCHPVGKTTHRIIVRLIAATPPPAV